VTGAHEASISTHGGSLAIAAAAATAAAVSAAIDGASSHDVLEIAERAAAHAESRWPGGPAPAFANAIRTVHDTLVQSFGGPDKGPADLPALRPADVASRCFPNQPMTIVPLALALATIMQSAEDAILLAANIGGDSDSVGSIAGGILGAMYPDTVNHAWYEVVERINDHKMVAIAGALGRLRH
jgi:ADP-ribosylglycohydrolase